MPRRTAKPAKPQKVALNSGCQNKRRYVSQAEAEAVKADQEALNDSLALRVYQCPLCGGWHLTRVRD